MNSPVMEGIENGRERIWNIEKGASSYYPMVLAIMGAWGGGNVLGKAVAKRMGADKRRSALYGDLAGTLASMGTAAGIHGGKVIKNLRRMAGPHWKAHLGDVANLAARTYGVVTPAMLAGQAAGHYMAKKLVDKTRMSEADKAKAEQFGRSMGSAAGMMASVPLMYALLKRMGIRGARRASTFSRTRPVKDILRTFGARKGMSRRDIKKAYRKAARKYHPDVNPNNPKAEERFKDISSAWTELTRGSHKEWWDKLAAQRPVASPGYFEW